MMNVFELLKNHLGDAQSLKPKGHWFNDWDETRETLEYDFREVLGGLEYVCGLMEQLQNDTVDTAFTDVTIKVDGKVFKGHRCVLTAASEFFETMFSSNFKESNAKEVELKDMDSAIFELVFKFMYSGQMRLCKDTALPALHAAAYLGLRNVNQFFTDYFYRLEDEGRMKPEDLLPVWVAAKDHNMEKLSWAIWKQMMHRTTFVAIMKTDLFLETATCDLITEYLRDENTKTRYGAKSDDQKLLRRIIQWLKHDWENRKTDAYRLLSRFRLGLMPKDKLEELMDAQILENPECKKMMDDMIADWKQAQGVEDPLKLPDSLLPKGMIRTLIAFGGKQRVDENAEDSDTEGDDWLHPREKYFAHYFNKTEPDNPWARIRRPELKVYDLQSPGAVVVDRDIYVAGGRKALLDFDGVLVNSDKLFKLDGKENTWSEVSSSMNQTRSRFPLVHLDGFLYAIGGTQEKRGSGDRMTGLMELVSVLRRDMDDQPEERPRGPLDNEPEEDQYLNSAERYNLSTQEWDKVYDLPAALTHTSAAVVEGKILVYGMKECVNEEGEYWLVGFDPVSQRWTKFAEEKYRSTAETHKGPLHSVLVVHEGACYRVKYEKIPSPTKKYPKKTRNLAHVNRVDVRAVRSGRGGFRASIGQEVADQDKVPNPEFGLLARGLFHIDGHIYINVCGFPHKTGTRVGDADACDLNGWKDCYNINKKTVVEYVIDSKKWRL